MFSAHHRVSLPSFCFSSMRLRLDRNGKRESTRFVGLTWNKGEFRRGTAILVLIGKRRRRVKDVARELGVSVGAVIRRERKYREHGLDGLKAGEHTGRQPKVKARAKRRMRGAAEARPPEVRLPEGEEGRPRRPDRPLQGEDQDQSLSRPQHTQRGARPRLQEAEAHREE